MNDELKTAAARIAELERERKESEAAWDLLWASNKHALWKRDDAERQLAAAKACIEAADTAIAELAAFIGDDMSEECNRVADAYDAARRALDASPSAWSGKG